MFRPYIVLDFGFSYDSKIVRLCFETVFDQNCRLSMSRNSVEVYVEYLNQVRAVTNRNELNLKTIPRSYTGVWV